MFYRIENIPDEQTMQAVVAGLLPLVPLVRRDKALRYVHLHGRYCCLRTWQMLHSLLIEHHLIPASFPLSALTYTEDAYGKPSFIAAVFALLAQRSFSNAVFFSLSHTKNALAVAVADRPVGIDIEAVVSRQRIDDAAFLDRVMSPDEQSVIRNSADPCLAFTELWTRKEALYKAIGSGIDLSTLPGILHTPHPYTFTTIHSKSYACTVAQKD